MINNLRKLAKMSKLAIMANQSEIKDKYLL
jgi:hypothetical protein